MKVCSWAWLLTALLLPLVLLSACGGEAGADDIARPELEDVVMTTFGPTTTFAERILGGLVPVVCPLPEGTDPVTWFPTRDVLERYQRARLVVVNGAEFERWVGHVSLAPSRLVDVSAGFEDRWLTYRTTTHSHGTGGEHTHDGVDGHTWMDPALARLQASTLRDALIRAWPEHEDGLRARAAALDTELADLGARLDALRSRWQAVSLFSNDAVYGYLANRMGGEVTDLGLDPDTRVLEQPVLDEITAAVTARGADGPRILLWSAPPSSASLPEGFGMRPVEYTPGMAPEPGGDYLQILAENIERLAEALQADASGIPGHEGG